MQEDLSPAMISSIKSSTPGRIGSKYIREVEIPSSYSAFLARSKASSVEVLAATALADAIPNDSLYKRADESTLKSLGDS